MRVVRGYDHQGLSPPPDFRGNLPPAEVAAAVEQIEVADQPGKAVDRDLDSPAVRPRIAAEKNVVEDHVMAAGVEYLDGVAISRVLLTMVLFTTTLRVEIFPPSPR